MGQTFDETCNQMKDWKWNNPHPFGDQVDGFEPQRTSWGMDEWICDWFSWYGSDDLGAKIELPSCW